MGYNNFQRTTPSKDSSIKKFVERKERGIADYTTKQEISIAVQSALRDAVLYCVNQTDWKKEMTDEQRFEWLDEISKRFVEFYAVKKIEFAELYQSIKGRHQEIMDKVETDDSIEINEELSEGETVQLDGTKPTV